MEVSKEFIAGVSKRQFDNLHAAREWWKAMTKEERKSAYEAWLRANPDDFRAGWGFELASISKNSIEAVWDHFKKLNNKS